MSKGAVLSLKITGDASGAKAALDDVEGHTSKFTDGLGKLAGAAAGAFAVDKIVGFGKEAFDAASNLEQMAGSVDAVFGQSASQIDALAAKAHTAVGLSTADYDQMASVIGSQLKNAGVPMDALAGKTDALIKQGADMSAVFGGSAADAVDALSASLRGEMDPIERYGVSLNQAAIDAQATADGAHKVNGAWSQQAKTAAVLELVTKQTAQTQGQFAAQSGTAAEKSQQLAAWFDNLKAKIGAGLLPIFTTLATFFTDKVGPVLDDLFHKGSPLMNVFSQVGHVVGDQLIPAITSLWNELAPKLIPILKDVGHFISEVVVPAFRQVYDFISTFVVPFFKKELSPVLDGIKNAFHSVTSAIMKHKDEFMGLYDSLKPFLAFIRDKVAPVIGGAFKIGFEVAGKAIGVVVDVIAKVVDSIKWILDKGAAVGRFIGKLFGAGDSGGGGGGGGGAVRGSTVFGASRTGGGRLFGAASSLGGVGVGPTGPAGGLTLDGGGDTYNITVTGALDPVAVADQIAALLDKRSRRIGLTIAGARA